MGSVLLTYGTAGLDGDDLSGFFVGWPDPPTNEARLGILRAADEVVIARSADGEVLGFATAITDRRFAAYIPLVEVLPTHRGQGIGSAIVRALLERLATCYMVDLACEPDVAPFYERLGGTPLTAIAWRYHDRLHVSDPGRTAGSDAG